ncbi:hypothetical protein FJZ31_09480 [Candidatus Poribacteria bacterium]|nr:hypothetical protein [Candidatus Poribacteria bacterium]
MKKEKLPDFETDEEFAEFFATHSFADYWDEFEDVEYVEFKRPMRKRITIRIFPYVLNNIRREKIGIEKSHTSDAIAMVTRNYMPKIASLEYTILPKKSKSMGR